jgi:hypothetical protein
MQYNTLLKTVTINDADGANPTVTMSIDLFRQLLITAVKAKGEFDEAFYLAANPDLRTAIQKKVVGSAAEHYYNTGYFEGKIPKRFVVDESYYLDQNPDVAKAISQRKVKNCQLHFETNGFREGRAPYAGFSLI